MIKSIYVVIEDKVLKSQIKCLKVKYYKQIKELELWRK